MPSNWCVKSVKHISKEKLVKLQEFRCPSVCDIGRVIVKMKDIGTKDNGKVFIDRSESDPHSRNLDFTPTQI